MTTNQRSAIFTAYNCLKPLAREQRIDNGRLNRATAAR